MTTMVLSKTVTLLNATYEPLSNVTLHRAIRLLHLGKAEIVEADHEVFIRSAGGLPVWPMPRILRLIHYVRLAYIHAPAVVSKRGVLVRDNQKCAYCGGAANTVDHVTPRSRGGKSSWGNLVAACLECNNRKRDRTPEEAGMKLLVTTYAPKRRPLAVTILTDVG